MRKNILVLCTGNSCRSQMAEGYLRHYAGDRAAVYSAGVETHGLNPRAVAAMQADGVNISHHTSDHLDAYRHIRFDFVLTVCDHAQERCPVFPGAAQRFHHNFPDPARAGGTEAEIQKAFAEVRDQIKDYCRRWVAENL